MKLLMITSLLMATLFSTEGYSLGIKGIKGAKHRIHCARSISYAIHLAKQTRINFKLIKGNIEDAEMYREAGPEYEEQACNRYADAVDAFEGTIQRADSTKKYAHRAVKYCKGEDGLRAEEYLKEVGEVIDFIDYVEDDLEDIYREMCALKN